MNETTTTTKHGSNCERVAARVEPLVLRSSRCTATLYCCDCHDLLPIEADAVVSDPPYGHGGGGGCLAESTKFAGEAILGDDQPFDPTPWVGYERVILWGGNHYASRLPDCACWLVWDKRDGVCSNDQADCELAWTNQKSPARLKRHLWNGMLKATERGEDRVHPMQKPVAVMEWAMDRVGVESGVVLDPFMGSGTTGIACIRRGVDFIGVEKDAKYFEIAVERIRREMAQGRMF